MKKQIQVSKKNKKILEPLQEKEFSARLALDEFSILLGRAHKKLWKTLRELYPEITKGVSVRYDPETNIIEYDHIENQTP